MKPYFFLLCVFPPVVLQVYGFGFGLSEKPLDTVASLKWRGSVPIDWFFPLISKTALASYLGKNKHLISKSDLNESCVMQYFNYPDGHVTAHGEIKEPQRCELSPGSSTIFVCTQRESKPPNAITTKATAIYTLTDNRTYRLTTFYFDDGQRDWRLYATGPRISRRAEKRILQHLKEIGFNIQDVLHLNYDHCSTRTWSQLVARYLSVPAFRSLLNV